MYYESKMNLGLCSTSVLYAIYGESDIMCIAYFFSE